MDDEQRCEHCVYFRMEAGDEAGECRRYPSTLFCEEDGSFSAFPHAAPVTWCGEFKRRVM